MEEKYCLVVYEEIPEDTIFYVLPWDVYQEHKGTLRACHKHFINSEEWGETPELEKLLELIFAPDGHKAGAVFDKYRVVDKTNPIEKNIQVVIWTGFLL